MFSVWPAAEDSRDGEGYRIMEPNYHGHVERSDTMEYRHSMSDIIMGLIERGFSLESIDNDPRHFVPVGDSEPGSPDHLLRWVQAYFALTARLGQKA